MGDMKVKKEPLSKRRTEGKKPDRRTRVSGSSKGDGNIWQGFKVSSTQGTAIGGPVPDHGKSSSPRIICNFDARVSMLERWGEQEVISVD